MPGVCGCRLSAAFVACALEVFAFGPIADIEGRLISKIRLPECFSARTLLGGTS